MKHSTKKFLIILASVVAFFVILLIIAYRLNFLPHRKYSDADFDITTFKSTNDQDNDGIDNQTDILISVKEYIATKPKYQSKYYATGYPDDEYGVCTDVVAFGLLGAGYDIMQLLHEDVRANPDDYDIEIIDKNIDFRRVNNLKTYLDRHATRLTTDPNQIQEWQAGDIVVFNNHIGIVSDARNRHGVPFVIHHYSPLQRYYEEDILETRHDIIGHYRV